VAIDVGWERAILARNFDDRPPVLDELRNESALLRIAKYFPRERHRAADHFFKAVGGHPSDLRSKQWQKYHSRKCIKWQYRHCQARGFLTKIAEMQAKPDKPSATVGKASARYATSFGAAQRALVWAFDVAKPDVPAFHGRLIALQKAGLLGSKNMPGKGRALTYTAELCNRLIFASELLQMGVAPRVIVGTVTDLWDRRIRAIFTIAVTAAMNEPSDDDIIFYMGGVTLMTDAWADAVPNVNRCKLGELPFHVKQWMGMRENDPAPGNLPPRVLMTNLTHRLRRFHAALAEIDPQSIKSRPLAETSTR